jgi:hypothetical protein
MCLHLAKLHLNWARSTCTNKYTIKLIQIHMRFTHS